LRLSTFPAVRIGINSRQLICCRTQISSTAVTLHLLFPNPATPPHPPAWILSTLHLLPRLPHLPTITTDLTMAATDRMHLILTNPLSLLPFRSCLLAVVTTVSRAASSHLLPPLASSLLPVRSQSQPRARLSHSARRPPFRSRGGQSRRNSSMRRLIITRILLIIIITIAIHPSVSHTPRPPLPRRLPKLRFVFAISTFCPSSAKAASAKS
jgi:hypothetical protein